MNTRKLLVSVLILVSVLFSACAPAATPVPPTIVPPTLAPTVAPASTLTTFSPKTFNLPITLSYGSEWSVAEEYSDVVTLGYTGHDAGVSFINVKSAKIANGIAFPDDFPAWIQSPDSLFQVKESKTVLIGGFQGIQINATAACGNKTNWIMLSGTGWKCPNGEPIGFIYLADVYGERVLIQIQGPPGGKDYEFIVKESQKVLDTVVFTKPTTFQSSTFKLPMTMTYGSDWYSEGEFSDMFTIKIKGTDYAWELGFILVAEAQIADPNSTATIPWPNDFVTYLQSNQYFEAGQPISVTVGGVKGIQIDALVKNIGEKRTFIAIKSTDWLYLDDTEMYRFIILDDVNGQRLLITMNAPPDGFSKANELEQKVLDTVAFSQPTTFSSKTFDLPITFSYGPEWKIDGEDSSEVVLKYKDYDGEFLFINPKTAKIAGPAAPYSVIPFPDDFVNWIQSHGLFQVVKTQSFLVGGLPGTQIDADATPACGAKTEWFLVGPGGWNCGEGGHYRFTYLDDVNGERLLIMTVGYISAQDFVLMTDASQQVLDTVVFSKPTTTFSPKVFKLITSVSFGSNWHVEEDLLHDLYLDNGQMPIVFNIVTIAQLVDPVGGNLIPFPDDFISWIQSDPDFQTSEPTQVTVGGISGVQIDATPNTKINKKTFGLTWNILSSDGDWRFILLDNVNGERVLIFMIAPSGKPFSLVPEQQQEAQSILDSVVFTK